jgi:hypothetical protein
MMGTISQFTNGSFAMRLTAEALQAALEKGDEQACIDLFHGTTEEQRKTVAGPAQEWLKKQAANITIQTSPNTWERNPLLGAAQAAALAACSIGQLRKAGWRGIPGQEDAFRILSDRKPAWLDDWVAMALDLQVGNWPLVRRLVREGLCQRPESDNYWLGMLAPHMTTLSRFLPVRDGLLADPGLLDEIWKLFEIEGSGELSLSARDKYCKAEHSWEAALVQLAAEARLPRNRLLDASLAALSRDFAQFRAGWFSRFHEALQPTIAERAERTDRYLHLLASKIPPTVSFALNALEILDKAGKLNARTVTEQVGPALFARSKGTVRAALKLLERAAQAEPGLKPVAARQAVQALAHEAAEVQGAALDLIEQFSAPGDKELLQLLRDRHDGLAASQKPRLDAWLGGVEEPASPATKSVSPELETLAEQARKIEPRLRMLAGLDHALAALKKGELPPALDFDGVEIPCLAPDHALVPIKNLEELIDRFAAVLEDPAFPDEVECVLDGVSRLCGERPADFARRTGPLAKRARALLKRAWGGAFIGTGPQPDLCGLAIAWTTGEFPETPADQPRAPKAPTVLNFLSQRAGVIAMRARKGVPAPLLGAPTHRGGWIDPKTLVARSAQHPADEKDPDLLDQVQALLRLAPDGRAAALKQAAKIDGEFGASLRYALGGDEARIGPTAALWVAAARARAPLEDDLRVEKKHPGLGPGAGRRARYQCGLTTHEKWRFFHVTCQPVFPRRVALELPTVLLHVAFREKSKPFDSPVDPMSVAAARWSGSVWPAGREPWFGSGAYLIGQNLDWWQAEWSNRAYLEPLADPDTPMRPMALLLLNLALAAKEPGESGLATDALIAAIDDGRLDGGKLGASMAELMPLELIKVARWAKTLREASRASPLHAFTIAAAIPHALRGDPAKAPRDLMALLDCLKELLLETGQALTDTEARAYLEAMKAGGKTAKLIRELLALQKQPRLELLQAAQARALAARLARADRWGGA